MKSFILLMMIWTPTGYSTGSIGSAEFASQSACEFAASRAREKFTGYKSTIYHVCVPKDDRP